jgi:hypothetical protein
LGGAPRAASDRGFPERVRCPICREGFVDFHHIKFVASELYQICDECEYVWPVESDLNSQPLMHFGALMREKRLPDHWDLVEIVRKP